MNQSVYNIAFSVLGINVNTNYCVLCAYGQAKEQFGKEPNDI